MKRLVILLISLYFSQTLLAQSSYTITVGGTVDKYYPVVFNDLGWYDNIPTVVQIGRSNINDGSPWWGSIIATFKFHCTAWGHGSNFVDADIHQTFTTQANYALVGGWEDPTYINGYHEMIIWLRGNTTYYCHSNYADAPAVYLSGYTDHNSNLHPVKAKPEDYVNTQGLTIQENAYFNGTGINYFSGNVGIGTRKTSGYQLAVNGTIGARKLKITTETWADYVFAKDYKLPSLQEVQNYISKHQHLPDVPSAEEVVRNGVDVGEMNKVLLKKVEELTLYLLQEHETVVQLKQELEELKKEIKNK